MNTPHHHSPITVGLTFDLAGQRPLAEGEPHDRDAELDAPATIDAIASALQQLGHQVVRIGNAQDLCARLAHGRLGVDVVFNVAEGTRGLGREAQVPGMLEAFGIAYTGADPVALAVGLDKGICKRLWMQAGLTTAPFAVLEPAADLAAVAVPYPAFVKPLNEGSSIGIDDNARVNDHASLRTRLQHIWRAYHQPALVEAYLPGPEFTVALLDRAGQPTVLGMLQTTPSGGTRAQQDKRASLTGAVQPPFEPVADRALEVELAQLALDAYRVIGARDYARIDIRCDAAGTPNLLEINPLPGMVEGRSPFPLIAARAGLSFTALIAEMMDGALRRSALVKEAP